MRVYETFCRTQQKVTELSLNFPASWKSLLDTMGLKTEDGCPNGTEELWVTVQVPSVSVMSRVLEVAYFLFA